MNEQTSTQTTRTDPLHLGAEISTEQFTQPTQATIRYRVMVEKVASNDGDVRVTCYGGTERGVGSLIAEHYLARLTSAVGKGVVLSAWIEPV